MMNVYMIHLMIRNWYTNNKAWQIKAHYPYSVYIPGRCMIVVLVGTPNHNGQDLVNKEWNKEHKMRQKKDIS